MSHTTATSRRARPRRDAWGRPATLAAAVVPAVALVLAGWSRRWTTDDAFINYRIVDHLLAGHGPVFNTGERVEVYTSTLWLAVLTVGDLVLPLPLEYVAVVLSLSLVAVGVITLSAASRRLLAGVAPDGAVWVPAGTLVLVALPAMWDFSTGGLETGLSLAWTGALALGLSRAVEEPADTPPWALVVAGLAPLVRPDAIIAGAAVLIFVAVATVRAAGWRALPRQVAWAGAIPVTYQVFRMAYFGALVPNTALAKQAGVPHWEEGWAYLVDLVAPYWLWVPVVTLLGWAAVATRVLPTRARVAVALLPAAEVLHVTYLVRAGGDYAHARLLLPALFATLAPVAMIPVRRGVALGVAAGVAVWAVVTAGFLRVGDARLVNRSLIADGRAAVVEFLDVDHPVTAEDQGWGPGSAQAASLVNGPVTVDQQPVAVTPPPQLSTPAAALNGVGVTGYAAGTDVFIIDRLGLADPLTARFALDRAGFIGHEKPIPKPWLGARISTEPVDPGQLGDDLFATPLYASPAGRFDQDVADARAALDCAPLRELRAATTARLTPGRAWANLWRAPERTRLEVPPSPSEARAELC